MPDSSQCQKLGLTLRNPLVDLLLGIYVIRNVCIDTLVLIIFVTGWLDRDDMSALESVMIWRRRLATEPRDKVFAMQGLMPAGEIDLVHTHQCDYNTPPSQIYSAFTLDLILGTETLQPLTLELRADPEMRTPGVPRWALDLLSETKYTGGDRYYRWEVWDRFDASAGRLVDRKAILEAPSIPESRMEVLGLTGVKVDQIEFIGAKMLFANPNDESGPPDEIIIETLKSVSKCLFQHFSSRFA